MLDTLRTGSCDSVDVVYTFSPKVHACDSKKDMHVDNTDLFLQIDKRLNEVTGKYGEKSLSPPVKMALLTLPRQCSLCGSFLAIYILCFIAALWSPAGRAGLFPRLYVKFSCVFVSFPRGVLGQVWCLIVLVPDLCILTYLVTTCVYVLGLFSHCR